jgi:hypothetical protein
MHAANSDHSMRPTWALMMPSRVALLRLRLCPLDLPPGLRQLHLARLHLLEEGRVSPPHLFSVGDLGAADAEEPAGLSC